MLGQNAPKFWHLAHCAKWVLRCATEVQIAPFWRICAKPGKSDHRYMRFIVWKTEKWPLNFYEFVTHEVSQPKIMNKTISLEIYCTYVPNTFSILLALAVTTFVIHRMKFQPPTLCVTKI